jgi:hypothetical protein
LRPRLVAVALGVVLTPALASCGGATKTVTVSTPVTHSTAAVTSGVTPAAYVDSVCTTATNWKNAIQAAGATLSAGVNTTSLATAKSEYVTFVGSLVSATEQAERQLSSAGSPSVPNGKQISGSLVRTFNQAKGALAQASSQASALPTSSSGAFQTAASKVVATIRSSMAGMTNVSPEKNSELHAAATKDPTCRRLAASGSGSVSATKSPPTPTTPQPASPPATTPSAPAPSTSPASPASSLTTSQQNAAAAAKNYLSLKGFSRQGLIDQLSSSAGDGYPISDATVAVDSLNVDWNAQAVRSAKDYLQLKPFSCQGLVEQLSSSAGDQYTLAQAQYGATKAGIC